MPKSDIIFPMDLRQLEIVQAVAETGSFTGAGRKLHVSQSAISRQILLLEDELNESIFLRVGREGAHHAGGRVAGAAEPSRVRRHQGNRHRHRRQPAGAERHDSARGRHDGVHVRVSDAAAGISAPAFARRGEAHHRTRRSGCCRRFAAARPTSGSSRCR